MPIHSHISIYKTETQDVPGWRTAWTSQESFRGGRAFIIGTIEVHQSLCVGAALHAVRGTLNERTNKQQASSQCALCNGWPCCAPNRNVRGWLWLAPDCHYRHVTAPADIVVHAGPKTQGVPLLLGYVYDLLKPCLYGTAFVRGFSHVRGLSHERGLSHAGERSSPKC